MSTATLTPNADPKPASPKKTFQQLVDSEQFKAQIANALPKHITTDRFIRVLMTATLKNPQLLECTQESLFKGIFDCAAIGLELDGRRAHLVPLRNRKKQGQPLEANLWLDYKGIAELVMRSGCVSNIHADVVCEKDEFDFDRGELKAHKINFKEARGEMYAAYAIIRMKDGGEKVEVMSKHEIDRVRSSSPGKDADPWVKHYNEQAKKTVFKRASKWVPLSSEVVNAFASENDRELINVTDNPVRRGLAQMLDDQAKLTAETVSEPAQAFTAEQRAQFEDAIKNYILDAGISEASLVTEIISASITLAKDLDLFEQSTVTLSEIAKYVAAKAAAGTVKGEVK